MKIVVIIVTYKGMKWYKKCFDSLRDSAIPVETVVIDNQSQDNTVSFIKENYPEIHLIESSTNLGFGKANNLGMKYARECKADYIYLLNQDAWIRPNTIESLVNKAKLNPEYGIISPIHLSGSENTLDSGFADYIKPISTPDFISDYITKGTYQQEIYPCQFINAAHWLITRECLEAVGGFEPLYYHYGEDVNYTHRIKYHGFKLGIDPNAYAIHDRIFRKQNSPTLSEMTKSQYIWTLSNVININNKFPKVFWRNLAYLAIDSIQSVLLLRFKKSITGTVIFFTLISNYFVIKRTRKTEEQRKPNYL